MILKILFLCVAITAVKAGYLQPGLRYVAPASIGIAAPAIARVEHLPPASASIHRTETYTAPIARTSLIAPAIHTVAATPLIPTGYVGHSFGYGAAPLGFGYAGTYRAGW